MKKRYLQIALGVFLIIFMVINPKEVFNAATLGLNAWWKMVFPALLPFFIGSQLLMGFGVVRFMGVLLEPIMRPLFNLPGAASFVMAMGFTSGTPIGAVITAKLREDKVLAKEESERVMSFCNNSSPLFMLAAVSVGMFNQPALGITIASAHYLANIVIGLFLGLISRKSIPASQGLRKAHWKRAVNELVIAYRENPQPLGFFIGDAIKTSVQTLLMIGGFVIFFSVLIRIFSLLGFLDLLSSIFGLIMLPLGFKTTVIEALTTGTFEMTLGAKAASEANAPLFQRVIVTGMILGWSGLAIHAQVATMIAKTDIKMKLFMACRAAQAILAGFFTWVLFKFFSDSLEMTEPVFKSFVESNPFSWFDTLQYYTLLFAIATGVLLVLALVVPFITTLRTIRSKL